MNDGGEFLVLDEGTWNRNRNRNWNRNPVGLRLSEVHRRSRVFRDAVHRSRQTAPGARPELIDAVEARARELGCRVMDIHIVNLREELPAYYRRLGLCGNRDPAVLGPRACQPAVFLHRHVEAVVTESAGPM